MDTAVFAQLLTNKKHIQEAVVGFQDAIEHSFITNPVIHLTQNEINKRFNICVKIFKLLRGDMKWSLEKCLDAMPTYLKCELDGVPYDPSTVRDSWTKIGISRSLDVARDPWEKYLIKTE